MSGSSREMATVRIPLRSAKHHFGVSVSRGNRPYNEDTFQAGVVELPAFAKKGPMSLTTNRYPGADRESKGADSASGDPQVFFFGVYDGHGGVECSSWLSEHLHHYVEKSAQNFGLGSSLKSPSRGPKAEKSPRTIKSNSNISCSSKDAEKLQRSQDSTDFPTEGSAPEQGSKTAKAIDLERSLIKNWRDLVGGYFRRFQPAHFSLPEDGSPHLKAGDIGQTKSSGRDSTQQGTKASIEEVLMYAFLKADLDFISAQINQKDEDTVQAERALNDGDILGEPHKSSSPPKDRRIFKGGSTCSVAMISTPTPTPFWHPASPCTVLISHVGDTRILLCPTATGTAIPLTTNHHPSAPVEARRLRRYAATFVTDSFGEERMSGLANTRAFGDMQSKRIGVSAEPDIRRVDAAPAEYSFMVLVSDGISGTLSDQEIVDIVKEARTPEQAARDVVSFATEVTQEGDNATCLVVRFGGWERRSEGGVGAMGTKEVRDYRRQEATDPRSRRT
ncbi:MAG: hypothetical protein M1814_000401 [Vezdaea aestivalis]|nr:MAG: hypothetical protein M1814_000401 [Vezdaea aestivalis]